MRISKLLFRMFYLPCSSFILNVALQLSLSSFKLSTGLSASSLKIPQNSFGNILKADLSCKIKKSKLDAPWRILFFGTDEFSVKSLQILCSKFRTNTLISKLEVVSSVKEKHSPVKQFANDEKLITYNWPLDPGVIKDNYDIGVVVSFGHLIPSEIINAFPLGMINVHGSVLPRWRGAAPIVHAVLHGDQETGISIIRIRPKHFDRGEIVRQYSCSISPHDTAEELHDKLAHIGGHLLLDCVRDMPRCLEKAIPQSEYGVTYAKKIDPSYSVIDWNNMTAVQIYNLHRALGHIYPLTAQWQGVKVKLHKISLDQKHKSDSSNTHHETATQTTKLSSAMSFLNETHQNVNSVDPNQTKPLDFSPGEVSFCKPDKLLRIKCKDGKYILCDGVTVTGKKKMSAVDFNNGFLCKVHNIQDRKFINLDTQIHSVEK